MKKEIALATREVVLWQNDDPEWQENGEKEQVVAVHITQGDHTSILIRCDTTYGFTDWPSDSGFGVKWDHPYKYSEECRAICRTAYYAGKKFVKMKGEIFSDSSFITLSRDEKSRYDNLLGLFYPEYRNDVWVNYLETDIDYE
jgi:hypothetical protein